MEPLSATASILTILGTGGAIAKGLETLRNLKRAPDVLSALNNEVNDAHHLINDVDDLLRKARDQVAHECPASFVRSLERMRSITLDLEEFIAYSLTTFSNNSTETFVRVDRSAYIRAEKRIQTLKDAIRTERVALASSLSLLSTSLALERTQLSRQLYCSVENLEALALSSNRLLQQAKQPQQTIESTRPSSRVLQLTADSSIAETSIGTTGGNAIETQYTQSLFPTRTNCLQDEFDVTSLEIFYGYCGAACRCRCHKYNSLQIPSLLHSILGSLYIGYRSSPWLRQACDSSECQLKAREVAFVYRFPTWLTTRVLAGSLKCAQNQGPELLLRVMRVRTDAPFINKLNFIQSHPDHQFVSEQMQQWLARGDVSIFDMDLNGRTLLYFAIRIGCISAAILLIRHGTDVHYKNDSGCSPFMLAWSYFSQSPFSRRGRLLQIMGDPNHVDDFAFPDLHRTYCGIQSPNMAQSILQTRRDDIDLTDMQGRTLLSWAAERGDSQTISLLLRRGADPNKRDNRGRAPLHLAVRADAVSCTRLLLEAGADANVSDLCDNVPLHYVVSTEVGECLLDFDASINGGHTAYSPMCDAIFQGKEKIVEWLLANDAICGVINIVDSILCNHRKVLELLLDHLTGDIQKSGSATLGTKVFYNAAMFASEKTLKVLASRWPSFVDDSYDLGGFTAQDVAEYRRDCNSQWSERALQPPDEDPEAWYQEFEAMVAAIEARHPTECRADCSEDRDDEVDDINSDEVTTSRSSEDENCVEENELEAESQKSNDDHQDVDTDRAFEEDGASTDMWEDARESLD